MQCLAESLYFVSNKLLHFLTCLLLYKTCCYYFQNYSNFFLHHFHCAHPTIQNFHVFLHAHALDSDDFRSLFAYTWFDSPAFTFSAPCDVATQPAKVQDHGGVSKFVLEATPSIVSAITSPNLDSHAQRALIAKARKKNQALSTDTTATAYQLCNFSTFFQNYLSKYFFSLPPHCTYRCLFH